MNLYMLLEEYAEHTHDAASAMAVWSAIAYEIYRAYHQDKACRACCDLRIVAAVHVFVGSDEYRLGNYQAAMAIARDHKQNQCEKCKEQRG